MLPAPVELDWSSRNARWLIALCAVTLLCSFFRTAWVCDDAYISFRVVRNLLDGYGLVWNVDERVQVYTHPLWVLLLVVPTAFLNDPYLGAMALSAMCLVVVAIYAVKIGGTVLAAAISLLVIATSRVFIDYSSSGLENPLTHALIAALAFKVMRASDSVRTTRANVMAGAVLGTFLVLNRMDLVLVVAPMVLYLLWKLRATEGWKSAASVCLLASVPALAWFLFATFYYGSPFPNTYFAKLSTGIPAAELRDQGFRYFWASFQFDEPSVVALAAALAVAPTRIFGRVLGISIALYMVYIIRIGGDFMVARFLSVPFLLSLFVLIDFLRASGTRTRRIATVACAAFLINVPMTVMSSAEYQNFNIPDDGIVDERGYFYAANGLQRNITSRLREAPMFAEMWINAMRSGATIYETCYVGMVGYYAPKTFHIVDGYGLTDPFLAKLPTLQPWRIGHFERPSPPGYPEILTGAPPVLSDPVLNELWTDIVLAHRADMLRDGRLGAIVRLNTGHWRSALDQSTFVRAASTQGKPTKFHCRGVSGAFIRPIQPGPAK